MASASGSQGSKVEVFRLDPAPVIEDSVTDDYVAKVPFTRIEVVARAAGFGSDPNRKALPETLDPEIRVYCGVDVNLETSVWLRLHPPMGLPLEVEDDGLLSRFGLTYSSVNRINGITRGRNIKPWVMLNYHFTKKGTISELKKLFNEALDRDNFTQEQKHRIKDSWLDCLRRGLPCQVLERLTQSPWLPESKLPIRETGAFAYVHLYAFEAYRTSIKLKEVMDDFRMHLHHDYITTPQVLLAIYVWFDLKTNPQVEGFRDIESGYKVPDVSLSVFIVYFGEFLRRVEMFQLATYPHPFRFIHSAYQYDEKRDRATLKVEDAWIDEAKVMEEMRKLNPQRGLEFNPSDLIGSAVPRFKNTAKEDRNTAFRHLREIVGSVSTVFWNNFDGVLEHAGLAHHVLVPDLGQDIEQTSVSFDRIPADSPLLQAAEDSYNGTPKAFCHLLGDFDFNAYLRDAAFDCVKKPGKAMPGSLPHGLAEAQRDLTPQSRTANSVLDLQRVIDDQNQSSGSNSGGAQAVGQLQRPAPTPPPGHRDKRPRVTGNIRDFGPGQLVRQPVLVGPSSVVASHALNTAEIVKVFGKSMPVLPMSIGNTPLDTSTPWRCIFALDPLLDMVFRRLVRLQRIIFGLMGIQKHHGATVKTKDKGYWFEGFTPSRAGKVLMDARPLSAADGETLEDLLQLFFPDQVYGYKDKTTTAKMIAKYGMSAYPNDHQTCADFLEHTSAALTRFTVMSYFLRHILNL
ncbi:hypothetical protein GGR52DRAFT_586832 [Hypoxylon sp. FL1284]|nr:hypothetical protein GGR52DRAFT_586832 [Hypoxylon sp. FL1284]